MNRIPWTLIIAKLNNTITEADSRLLEEWLQDNLHSEIYLSIVDIWNSVQSKVRDYEPDEEYYWTYILGRINQKAKKKNRVHRFFISRTIRLGAVASLLLIIGFSFFVYLMPMNDKSDIALVAAQMVTEVVEGDDIRLVVSQEEVLHVKKGATVDYSQEGIVRVDEEKVAKNTTDNLYDQIIVPKGKYTRLILADGSSLHINAGTKVVYPKQFEKNRREIFVDGEIYIDVKQDESAPFIVKTAGFDVQVLGTAFDIKAYSGTFEDGEVVLVRGKVNVKSKSGKKMTLSPNNKATILSDGLIEKSQVNAEEYVLWTKGILSLNNEPLNVILAKISRYYGVDVQCADNIANIKIAGKIDLECGIEEALKRISVTGSFSFSKEEDTYMIESRETITQ